MKRTLWVCTILLTTAASAQTGPMLPRFVMSKPAPVFEVLPQDLGRRAQIELQLDETGRVMEVRLLKSSGSAAFDEATQRYYRSWRLIPAVDEHGKPMAATMRMMHTARGNRGPNDDGAATLGSTAAADDGSRASPDTGGFDRKDPRLRDEHGRVARMRCKDFLWEYDLLRDIAGGATPLNLERMTQTAFVMAFDASGLPDTEGQKLGRQFKRIFRDAARNCRNQPDAMFLEQVLVPVMKAK